MTTLSGTGLTKRYGDHEVVRSIDLEVHPAEVVGLLGPNGAGKTTTFNMLAGGVRPTRGKGASSGRPRSPSSPCTAGPGSESRIFRRNPRYSGSFPSRTT